MGDLSFFKNFLSGSWLDMLVYVIILSVFIIGLIKCVSPVLHNRSLLRRAIRNIRAGTDAKQSWQEDNFLGNGALCAHWSEYLNNLFFADGVYHNASNVEDYINEETVIFGPGRGSLSDAVPGLLTSLGFLGTLIGLTSGLSGFSMSDSDAVMNSIVTLIPGMRYAFMTSIFGVVGSLAFTLITRAAQGSTERTLRDFYGAMSRYAGVLSVDPMTQVAIYQQEQTALIKQMSADLGGRLSDNVAEAVGRAVEPLSQSLRSFVSVTTKDQMRFLDAVVNRFMDRMDDALGGQLRRFGRALDEAASLQEDAIKTMRMGVKDTSGMLEGMREVARIANDMVETNSSYIRDLQSAQARSQEAFAKLSDSVDQMDMVSRQQDAYLKSVSAMQAEVTRSVDQMTTALKGFTDRMSENSAAATASMSKAAAELRATGASLQDIHRDCTAEITNELKMTLDAYQDYVNQFTQRVDYLASGITEALGRLPRSVDDASNQFLDQIDRLTDALAQAQTALNRGVADFYAASRDGR